jgi:hypothetical protein
MLRKRIRIVIGAELMQQPCRAFHVGEEEGDSPGGKIARRH